MQKRFIKTDWSAKRIWLGGAEKISNTWVCFSKDVQLEKIPEKLVACISADDKYLLLINGRTAVREGGLKRGPSPSGCYYDEVDIAPYLIKGNNRISVLVWYWGNEVSYSSSDSGQGSFLFEAIGNGVSVLSDKSWRTIKNPAFMTDKGKLQPNYRLPESNVYYDARFEENWYSPDYDFSHWQFATEYPSEIFGETVRREIPMFRDYGLKDYENSNEFEGKYFRFKKKITLKIPYNAQITPYLEADAPKGRKIVITTENTPTGSVHSTYVTKNGVQQFESPAWFNGEYITYEIPSRVKVLSLRYRESGYDTDFNGSFECDSEDMNRIWQKSLRTLYVTMRDNYMDWPDRERAQWWGDVTNEMMLGFYALSPSSYQLYQKGVRTMLSYVDPATKVLQTVVPIKNDYFELPCQQLAGVCGFWNYYCYTGDTDFLREIYLPATEYVNLWHIAPSGLVEHREGSWDWQDWGDRIDVVPLENAWYHYALQCLKNMAETLGDIESVENLSSRIRAHRYHYQKLWSGKGYKGEDKTEYDDRGNAVAVLAGLCDKENYADITETLFSVRNSSPYMEYYVLEALCKMGEYALAEKRISERYREMIDEDYSTLWENWIKADGTSNHAWSGGPLVILSRHIAGISPVLAGYESVEIKPQYALHNHIRCTVPTVRGLITFEYRKGDGENFVSLDYPENTKVFLYPPENCRVTVRGKEICDVNLGGSYMIFN